jgi:tricorn protease
MEARGEIFTVPVDKGDARNLTRSAGAADRAPVWSPDGERGSPGSPMTAAATS